MARAMDVQHVGAAYVVVDRWSGNEMGVDARDGKLRSVEMEINLRWADADSVQGEFRSGGKGCRTQAEIGFKEGEVRVRSEKTREGV